MADISSLSFSFSPFSFNRLDSSSRICFLKAPSSSSISSCLFIIMRHSPALTFNSLDASIISFSSSRFSLCSFFITSFFSRISLPSVARSCFSSLSWLCICCRSFCRFAFFSFISVPVRFAFACSLAEAHSSSSSDVTLFLQDCKSLRSSSLLFAFDFFALSKSETLESASINSFLWEFNLLWLFSRDFSNWEFFCCSPVSWSSKCLIVSS